MKNPFKLFMLILFFLIVFVQANPATAEEHQKQEKLEDELVEELSFKEIETYWNKVISDYRGYVPELEKTTVTEFIKQKETFSFKNMLKGISEYFLYELLLNGKLLGTLIVLVLFSTFLQTIHSAFEKNAVSQIAYFVVYFVLIFVLLNSFYSVFEYTKATIQQLSDFMLALLPMLLGLMSSFGNLLAVSFFQPIIIFIIYLSSLIVSKFSLPLLFLSALLFIVSFLNEQFKLIHLAKLLRTVSIGILGILMTLFISIMSIQGTASAVQDGIAMKTTKFITGNFIPVIGRTFTDATDTVFTASLLLKNAVGIIGLILISFITLFPILKIAAIGLIYKVSAAILEPLGDGPMIEMIAEMSKYIFYVLACLLVVTLMFFLAIVIIIVASNVTLFLR